MAGSRTASVNDNAVSKKENTRGGAICNFQQSAVAESIANVKPTEARKTSTNLFSVPLARVVHGEDDAGAEADEQGVQSVPQRHAQAHHPGLERVGGLAPPHADTEHLREGAVHGPRVLRQPRAVLRRKTDRPAELFLARRMWERKETPVIVTVVVPAPNAILTSVRWQLQYWGGGGAQK